MKIQIQNHEEPATVILDQAMIDQLTRGNIIDAPVTLLKTARPVWILPTAMQQNGQIHLSHTFVRGELSNLSECDFCVIDEHQLFNMPDHLNRDETGRHWITKLVPVDGGLLTFLHSEYTGPDEYFGMQSSIVDGVERRAPGTSRIGLAWLPNERLEAGIYNFDYLGHIAGCSAEFPHFNVSGTPAFINESNGTEYINIFFSDTLGDWTDDGWNTAGTVYVSQARAPLQEVVAGAKAGKLTPWLKRDGEDWNDALAGVSSGILPQVEGVKDIRIATGDVIVHSDAFYHEASEKFILIGYVLKTKRRPSCLVAYTSDDGLDWQFAGTFLERSDGLKGGWSYISIIERDDLSIESEEPDLFLLVGWNYGSEGRCVYKLELSIE